MCLYIKCIVLHLQQKQQLKTTIMTTTTKTQSRVNGFLNLKARMIDSLRSQGIREAWIMPTLKASGIYNIQFPNK